MLSSDRPNLNLKFLELYAKQRDLDELPSAVDLGTCGLYTIHGSLKNGVKCSGWNTGKSLKALLKLMNKALFRSHRQERHIYKSN